MKKNLLLLGVLVVLMGAAYWIFTKSKASSIADKPFTAFAIEDTATVTRIFIAEPNGATVTLDRVPGNNTWNVNGKYQAREDAVQLLLKTFARMRVRGNVAEKARDNMIRVLAAGAKKVEVYQGGKEPSKIYYVGPATQDHMGTIMLLELPGEGRSEDPYIVHMEGFTGFLSTRFFADETDWRFTGVFDFPSLDFRDVKMIDHNNQANSFQITYTGGNNIALLSGYNPAGNSFIQSVNKFDSLAVKDYLLLYKKVHVESFKTDLTPQAADSISKVAPAFTLEVTDNTGHTSKVDLIWKRSTKVYMNENGEPSPWDLEYFWARMESGELAMAQSFVFNPLIQPLAALLPKQTARGATRP